MEEENILSVDHLGLKRFYFSSKWLLPSVLGQCWRAHLGGAGPKLLAPSRGKGGEQEPRSWCRVTATPQLLWPLSCCGAARALWIPPLLAGTRRGCGCLSLVVPITRCGVGTRLPALTADPRGAGPMTLVPSSDAPPHLSARQLVLSLALRRILPGLSCFITRNPRETTRQDQSVTGSQTVFLYFIKV